MAMRNLFSFDASRETPEMLAERRARAAALAGQIGGATTIGGGIGDIFRGLGAGLSRYRADSAEREGNASGRSAMDGLLDILSQPQGQPMSTPSNDAVRDSLKTGISTGTVPPLATYTPPGPQNAGDPNGRPQPSYAPPMAEESPMEPEAPPMAQPAPQPAAGPDRKVMAQMVAVLRNPWVPEADKAMVRERYNDLLKKSDPDYIYEQQTKRQKDELEIGLQKIQLHNLQNPERKMEAWTDPNNGNLYAYDPRDPAGTKVLVQEAGPKAENSEGVVLQKGARLVKNGKVVDLGGGPEAATEVDVDNAIKIQKNFEGQPAMTNLQTIAPTLKSMLRSVEDPSAMADLDFIYGLAKILDPTSVVRESEAGMVIDSQGIGPQMLGTLNKMLSGEQALTRETRLNLFKVAARRGQELANAAKTDRAFAGRQLRSMAIPEDDYLRPIPSVPKDQNMQAPFSSQPTAPRATPRAPATAVPPGWDPEDWKFLTPEEQQRALSP
ncbi:MAG: hypothetical protein ABL936_00425 [Aestuariivirga sp.]